MITLDQFKAMLERQEQVTAARNTEEFRAEHPDIDFPPSPFPPYAELAQTAYDEYLTTTGAKATSQVLTTDTGGNATLEFAEMDEPVVTATVTTSAEEGTFYQAAVQALSSTSAVIHVTQSYQTTVLGLPILSAPIPASGVNVHVSAIEAG